MSNLVIVAIPDENDRVWQVSSEQIPHMTLLFLGDADTVNNLDQIMLFVEHATSMMLQRFYLPVDYRGELGADQADVLFFKANRYDGQLISHFRTALLQDNNIKTAYDAATQFEGPWQPHLTLGYPATPAKSMDPQATSFYDVAFNKIAVWTKDFDGMEFLLRDYSDDFDTVPPMAMNDISAGVKRIPKSIGYVGTTHKEEPVMFELVDEQQPVAKRGVEFLSHYGVKGMKWGVRKAGGGDNTTAQGETKRPGIQKFLDPQGHNASTDVIKTTIGYMVPIVAPLAWPANIRLVRGGIRGAKAKVVDAQEKKFVKNAMSPKNFAAIHNGAQASINRSIDSINKKYPEPGKNAKTRKQYDDEVLKAMQDGYRASANSLSNKAGTQHLDVEFTNDGMDFKIHARQGAPIVQPVRVKHAVDTGEEDITVEITGKIQRDATGHITGFTFDDLEPAPMAQSAIERGSEFMLEHYGVKGMHWGVRREGAVTTQTHIDSGLLRRQTKIQAKGGEAHPAHPDAIKAAISKQKIKKSGTAALSTQELRDLANRLQVEGQVSTLMSSKGKKFVNEQLNVEGKRAIKKGAKRGAKAAAPHVIRKASKAAATAATIAVL